MTDDEWPKSAWLEEFTQEYKGYTIKLGSIWKDGELHTIFLVPLEASKEDNAQQAKKIIDEKVAQKK